MTAPRARTSGGFNQGLGQFNDSFGEHLDENAMQAAVQQKAQAQQSTSSAQTTTGGSALGAPAPVEAPREVGTIKEELLERPIRDVVQGLQSFFDLNQLLGINPEQDDPETKLKKKQMLQRWQALTEEDQQVVKQKYQQEMQKKQQEEQEKVMAAERERQANAQTLQVPTGPRRGTEAAGKPRAVQQLEQDRKSLGGPQKVG